VSPLLPSAAVIAAGGVLTAVATPLLVLASLGGAARPAAQAPPSATARTDIPAALLAHYQQAAACTGLPWQVVAAIGAVESNHARFGGAQLDPATGTVSPPIVGPALNGHGYAAIRVPAGGSPWHPDPIWDHAAGPMQFLTATWAAWGIDASGDRLASPHNVYDAIATAGRYLCNGQPRLDSITVAIRRYNPSERYVTQVLAKAHTYGMTDDRGDPAPQRPPVIDAVGGPVVHGAARRVVDFALAQLGKPYVWGAAGPAAYDCSGLTLAAYASIGLRLPHYAADQVHYGQPIDWHRQPIRAGDLLLLRGGDPIHDYGHVGIALNTTHWVNSPQAGQSVTVAPLPYQQLQGVRRLFSP